MYGDDATISRNQDFHFRGNASLAGRGYYLTSDDIQYFKQSNQLDAVGSVRMFHPDFTVESEEAQLAFGENRGKLLQSLYFLPQSGQRGYAEVLEYDQDSYVLRRASYTSCEGDDPDWELRASYLHIQPLKNSAVAHNVRLRLGSVPIMYVPWIAIPVEGRKSGLLAPEFSYSEVAGLDIKAPYYLNLAPDYDATLNPRWIEQRGTQLGTEFRWLSERGRLTALWEYLPDDRLTGESRQFVYWNQSRRIGRRSSAQVLYQQVSDPTYFNDLGSNLSVASQTWLEQQARFATSGSFFSSAILVQNYQRLALAGAQPYQRLPTATLALFATPGPISTRMDMDYTYFHQPELADYHRLYLATAANWQFSRPWSYVRPTARAHFHRFADRVGNEQTAIAPDLQLHGGIFLDRYGQQMLQSLEPAWHWVWKSAPDQSSYPLFDSRALPFRPAYVRDGRRYSGRDRTADTHFAATTLDYRVAPFRTGQQLFSAQLGYMWQLEAEQAQISGLRPRLPGDNPAWLNLQSQPLQSWQLSTFWILDPHEDEPLQSYYQADFERNNQVASISYTSRNRRQQLGVAGLFPLSERWEVIGRAIWILSEQRFPEALAGFQYNNCCWNLRLTASRFQRDANTTDTAVAMQLELKGFSSLGQQLDKRFTRELLGYNDLP